MLWKIADEFATGKHRGDAFRTNLLIESFAVHLRALWQFFWPTAKQQELRAKGKSNDLFVDDFLPGWREPQPPELDDELLKRINREIAHLTADRFIEPSQKEWPVADLYNAMRPAIRKLDADLPAEVREVIWDEEGLPVAEVKVPDGGLPGSSSGVFSSASSGDTGVTLPPPWAGSTGTGGVR